MDPSRIAFVLLVSLVVIVLFLLGLHDRRQIDLRPPMQAKTAAWRLTFGWRPLLTLVIAVGLWSALSYFAGWSQSWGAIALIVVGWLAAGIGTLVLDLSSTPRRDE